MIILAIDTALEACAAGVSVDGAVPIVITETIGRGHAEHLFGIVDRVLAKAEIALADVDRFAVATGPGSFTGIRVGIAAVRGFALVTKTPMLGLSTLAIHAEEARMMAGAVPVLAVLPAKGDEVFGQFFKAEGTALDEPVVAPMSVFLERVRELGAVLAGAGAVETAGTEVIHSHSAPDMASMLRLAARTAPDERPPRPLYVKPPDAAPAKPAIARR